MNLEKNTTPMLLCKACQSGKTGEALRDWVIEQITSKTIKAGDSHIRKLGIFICDNSLLLTKQTNIRAQNYEVPIKGDIVTMSSKERIKRVERLYRAIVKNSDLTTILCCGNNKRLRDISELLKLLFAKSQNYELFIYMDEADKILHSKNAKVQLELWRKHPLVSQITLITATPHESSTSGLSINFGKLQLQPVINVTDPNYHRLEDSILIDTEDICSVSNAEHVEDVLKMYKDGPAFGDVWFVPGEHKIKTHDEIEKILFESGFNCVLKINGMKKQITYIEPRDKEDDVGEDYIEHVKTFKDIHEEIVQGADSLEFSPYNNELSRWLERYYIRNNGKERWKLAITGNICISRGISIQSPGCLITHAIYGPNCSRSHTGQYQMFARVCGNIKHFPKYSELGPPMIFCSRKMFNQSCKMEQQAMDIAELSQVDDTVERITIDQDHIFLTQLD